MFFKLKRKKNPKQTKHNNGGSPKTIVSLTISQNQSLKKCKRSITSK
jgi:hypothetical protein